MAEKKLARYVTVAGATYGPDDELPKGVEIDNPKAFEEPDDRTPSMVVADKQGEEMPQAADPKSQATSRKSEK